MWPFNRPILRVAFRVWLVETVIALFNPSSSACSFIPAPQHPGPHPRHPDRRPPPEKGSAMKLRIFLPLLLVCAWFSALAVPSHAAATKAIYTGGAWTLALTYQQAAYGRTASGTFRSAHQSFQVYADWVPTAGQGSHLLRFHGHPFSPTSPLGLVGLATLANTYMPTCVASNHYNLTKTSVSPQISAKLPGMGKASLILHLHP